MLLKQEKKIKNSDVIKILKFFKFKNFITKIVVNKISKNQNGYLDITISMNKRINYYFYNSYYN